MASAVIVLCETPKNGYTTGNLIAPTKRRSSRLRAVRTRKRNTLILGAMSAQLHQRRPRTNNNFSRSRRSAPSPYRGRSELASHGQAPISLTTLYCAGAPLMLALATAPTLEDRLCLV